MASKYSARPRFEHSRPSFTTAPISLDENGFQMVTRKQKALGNLTDTSVNTLTGKTRTEKPRRPPMSTKLAEKEVRQQTIQFSSSLKNFTGTLTTSE